MTFDHVPVTKLCVQQRRNISAICRTDPIKQRIDDLEAMHESGALDNEWETDGWQMWVDEDARRIYLEIEGGRLTTESFATIRSAGGFNWSRRDSRFVRKITPNALRAVNQLAQTLDTMIEHE